MTFSPAPPSPPTSPSGTYSRERMTEIVHGQPRNVEFWAFIPSALPPRQAWSPATLRLCNDAMFALGHLSGLSLTRSGAPLSQCHLLRPLLLREATLSSRIEGIAATVGDALAYRPDERQLPGQVSGASHDDVRSVVNYLEALEYGLTAVAERPLTLHLVRELHGMLVQDTHSGRFGVGEIRTSQNFIGHAGGRIQDALHIPPPAHQVQGLLHDLFTYLRVEDDDAGTPLLARVAYAHYQFEAIHPFLDGNGRVGRILIVLLLHAWGVLPLPVLNLSAWFEHHRAEYYRALNQVTRTGAWEDWIAFFLRGVHAEALAATRRIEHITLVQEGWRASVTHLRTAGRLHQIIEYLVSNPITTVREVEAHLQVTYRTANNLLDTCLEHGVVRILNEGQYRRLFVAQDLLDAIEHG